MKPGKGKIRFNAGQLNGVSEMVSMAEELVHDYYKMSLGNWLKNRYDVKTAENFSRHEFVSGPFAQVVKYEGNLKKVPTGTGAFAFYTICLQDHAILNAIQENGPQKNSLAFRPFLLYILTHELVHIVRFSKFEHRYENRSSRHQTLEEEQKVHRLTFRILEPVKLDGLPDVFLFYRKWLEDNRL